MYERRSTGGTIIPKERNELAIRILNVSIASVVLVVLSPILLAFAVLVSVTSHGPAFYKQVRIGRNGVPFLMVKYRSMCHGAEKGTAVHATTKDTRTTRLGKYLRRHRLDEIPQLLNVLTGDMNIVGPRPERPTFHRDICQKIPDWPSRLKVAPGITGWAQINVPYSNDLESHERKLDYDREYLQRQGFWFDVRIMVSTLPVMLFGTGAK